MLVLTRKIQESVVVGEAAGQRAILKVTVLDVRGGKVKLGFEVDQDIPVHRSEVWERIQANGSHHDLAVEPVAPAGPTHVPKPALASPEEGRA
ncbi:hypothetical protein AYO44_05910 [Planctomycetaceae bacterium SCGC AG-212-F19]|nr:hypothetical protein AYO44_05910 [Planctomycetaceae bacterium SCGC AG-212-F19]